MSPLIDVYCGLLFLMVAGHALCDFPLQPPQLASAKRVGGDPYLPWWAALLGHGLIHGGAVALITGLWTVGVAETVTHAAIDGAKCRGLFGMKVDQALHLACKVVWAGITVAVLS